MTWTTSPVSLPLSATTTTPANVTALLQHSFTSDTDGWFEVIAAGGIVPQKKPSPDIYHYAMTQMSITPARCLAFEDSLNGLLSSTAAGLVTLVTVAATVVAAIAFRWARRRDRRPSEPIQPDPEMQQASDA